MYHPTATATGLDISDQHCHVCVVDEGGEVADRARLKTSPKALRRYFSQKAPTAVAIEIGTHSRWVARLLTQLGHEVVVANARKLRAIYENENKDDELDAEMLARLRRLDPKLLYPIQGLSERDDESLAMLRARDRLVQARTKLINCVRGMVKSAGHRMPRCDADSFHRRRADLPEELSGALTPVMDAIEALHAQIRRLERQIERTCEVCYPETERLRQVPGVGPITALAFVLTIGDPSRFPRSRQVGSYLGLRPGRDKSGKSDPQRGITKCGDRYLRRLLVGAAQYILGPFGKPSALRDWGTNLAARGGPRARKRAAVAVARKLAVLLHRLWVSGEDYRPYPNGEPGPLVMVRVP